MRTLGHKEKNDLFFQYLVAFVITAGLLLGALFLPHGDSNIVINDGEKDLYKEFTNFEKSKPTLIKLIDTVQSEAKKIATQNAGGNAAIMSSNDLLNEFTAANSVNSFTKSITDLLNLYITTTAVIKSNLDMINELDSKIKDCKQYLSNKNTHDILERIENNP